MRKNLLKNKNIRKKLMAGALEKNIMDGVKNLL